MPTAGLLFIALIALYIAASGKAKKILEAIGAKPTEATGDTGVPSTDGQGLPENATGQTSLDMLSQNAMAYNTKLNNPGDTNGNSDNPLLQTNFGLYWDSLLGAMGSNDPGEPVAYGDGYLGPPISSGGGGYNGYLGPPVANTLLRPTSTGIPYRTV